jgi:hypothetical protein
MAQRLKIYMAGPYTAESEELIVENVHRAIDAGIDIYKRGHYPYIPHLTHYVDERSMEIGAGLAWEDYLTWDRAWVLACDAIFLLGHSRGADLELEWARAEGKLVFDSLDDIPKAPPHGSPTEPLEEQSHSR